MSLLTCFVYLKIHRIVPLEQGMIETKLNFLISSEGVCKLLNDISFLSNVSTVPAKVSAAWPIGKT